MNLSGLMVVCETRSQLTKHFHMQNLHIISTSLTEIGGAWPRRMPRSPRRWKRRELKSAISAEVAGTLVPYANDVSSTPLSEAAMEAEAEAWSRTATREERRPWV